jgi:hypothetical protein
VQLSVHDWQLAGKQERTRFSLSVWLDVVFSLVLMISKIQRLTLPLLQHRFFPNRIMETICE